MSSLRPVLIIAIAFSPENQIGAFRPTRFAKYLPQFGYQPYVITATPQPEPHSCPVRRVPNEPSLATRVIDRFFSAHLGLKDWLRGTLNAAEDVLLPLLSNSPIVFTTSPPAPIHIPAMALKERHNLRWVADFRDPMIGNQTHRRAIDRALDKRWEPRIAELADGLVLNTEGLASDWKLRYPSQIGKMHAIPNGFDPEDGLGPLPPPARPHKVWMHTGSIYKRHYPRMLFESLASVVSSNRWTMPLQLRFLGEIMVPEVLEEPGARLLTDRGLINCTNDRVPLAQALRETAESDATIVFDHYRAAGNILIPAKTYDYIRIGKPILAFTAPQTPLERLLKSSDIRHICIYDGDTQDAREKKLIEFSQLPPDPVQPSKSFLRSYSAPEQTRQLAAIFDRL